MIFSFLNLPERGQRVTRIKTGGSVVSFSSIYVFTAV